jgi:hypothetical protein|tara:strand:- start:487 stop:738 length:252 start_codon:yes stop_codon:yes gene_type:complete
MEESQMNVKCSGCKKDSGEPIAKSFDGAVTHHHHYWIRYDHYGIQTGMYCDECYESNDSSLYPYRKDDYYDPAYAGEMLEEDY